MTQYQSQLDRIRALVSPVIAEDGYELVDLEITFEAGRKILRFLIDKADGVALGDCAKVSHSIEDLLEVENVMNGRYSLEVSSPGLNRPLRTAAHFARVVGQVVNVVTHEKLDGRRNFKGTLQAITDDKIGILIDNQLFTVPLKAVQKANLEVQF